VGETCDTLLAQTQVPCRGRSTPGNMWYGQCAVHRAPVV
jgi:hypothetical protein